MIPARVRFRTGGFAQHVVAVGIALRFKIGGTIHSFHYGFTQNELPPHFLHRAGHGGPDDGFAQTFYGGLQMTYNAGFAFIQHAAGQHQRPGGGIDQRRGGFAQMAAPV